MSSINLPELADLQDLAPRQLTQVLTDLDMVKRRVDAMIAEAVGVADRSAAYAEDGHASVTGWLKATCNYSGGETKAVLQTARLLHTVDDARTAAHAGTVGVPQLRLMARVFANPRCADQLPDSAALLVGHAQE